MTEKLVAKKLLVVDDQDEFHQFIKAALKDYNIDISDAFDGGEALEKVKQERYDLVLLDLMMPRATGGDFIRMVHSHGITLPPLVVMSSMSDSNLVKNVLSIGASAFIHKPIDAVALRDAVRKLLRI